MAVVHWLGAGLSAVPGIRRLADAGQELVLWNRTLAKAEQALVGIDSNSVAKELDWSLLKSSIKSGDVLVSMLPANMHMQVAEICLDHDAHFVSSSYVSAEMESLSERAKSKSLCFVNEVGLDPGLDHLMAHVLVHGYKNSPVYDPANKHYFRSYCGGFPKQPNDFKYKFSWSPLGVLRALKSPAQWRAGGEVKSTEKPWTSITKYNVKLPEGNETFQAYPNRDSLPFMEDYNFGSDWNVHEFVRGTLRLDGWSEAWQEIFALVEQADGEQGQQRLAAKSDELWNQYSYEVNEPDRVVLSVELRVDRDDETVWHQVYCLDEVGNEKGSAMARLVSLTTSIAVESVLNGELEPGVSPAPSDLETAKSWLAQMTELGERFESFVVV